MKTSSLYLLCLLLFAWGSSSSTVCGFLIPSSSFPSTLTKKATILSASIPDYLAVADVRSVKPNLITGVDTDFLGMINFCLRQSDNALSGPSRSKVLNEITNVVFKSIIIGFQPLIDQTLDKFPYYRHLAERSPCVLDPDEKKMQSSRQPRIPSTRMTSSTSFAATPSATAVEAGESVPVIENCEIDQKVALTYIDWLQDLLEKGEVHHDAVLGGIYDRGYKRLLTVLRDANCRFPIRGSGQSFRPIPMDQNICLSLVDLRAHEGSGETKTKLLNRISNIVTRAILFGGKKERLMIAEFIENHRSDFAQHWANGDMNSQEVLYLRVLELLLKENLSAAEAAITFVGEEDREKDATLLTTNKEKEIRPLNESFSLNFSFPSSSPVKLRLYDTYQNAFHRVVEVCLTEIGSQSGNYLPQNDEMVENFLLWEQTLRRDLTVELWDMHPQEMLGTWQLVDVAGTGSLSSITTTSEEIISEPSTGLKVEFLPHGKVEVKHHTNKGDQWTFKPGPAHLDTCEFIIYSKTNPDLLVKHVGFIDRGQRIESRFSRNPLRMTGRAISIYKGEPKGSSRFVMVKKNANTVQRSPKPFPKPPNAKK